MGEDVVFGYWKEGEIIYPTRVFSIENPRTRAPGAPGPGVHVTKGCERRVKEGSDVDWREGETRGSRQCHARTFMCRYQHTKIERENTRLIDNGERNVMNIKF